jgi:hypothetical protein
MEVTDYNTVYWNNGEPNLTDVAILADFPIAPWF